jgi:putative colanic acid biosysnthesis UDP-glucose lipid carrier transferase
MIAHRQHGIRPHYSRLALVHRVADMGIIFLGLYGCVWLQGDLWSYEYAAAALLAIALFKLSAENLGLYRAWPPALVTQLWLLTLVGLLTVGYLTKTTDSFSRLIMALWALGTPLALVLYRAGLQQLLASLRARGHSVQIAAIGGANLQGHQLADYIQRNSALLGLRLIGLFDDREPNSFALIETEPRVHPNLAGPLIGSFHELVEYAQAGKIDVVYITLPLKAQERIAQIIQNLADSTVSVYIVPDFFAFDLLHARWVNIGSIPTISIFETPFYGVQGFAKRLEDLILSALILLLIAAPMLIIAIGVKRSSPGPVLFRQTRYGLDGRRIKIWKFRTMTVCEDGARIAQAQLGDRRVTRFGAFLRRTSLDELPQFFNVLMGRMSIVGPRPHAVAHNELYRKLIPGYMLRHKVKPGITGWAQINGWRGETDTIEKMQKRIEFDLWYIRNWSLWADLKIIGLTVIKAFGDRNAY